MVSCFKRIVTLSVLTLVMSCGQDGVAPGFMNGIEFEGTVTTIAGVYQDNSTVDGAFIPTSRFNTPRNPKYDGSRYVYVLDASQHVIRRMDTVTSTVTTVAGTAGASGTTNAVGAAARFSQPADMAIVGNYAYIADFGNHRIRRMNLTTYDVTTFAGANSGNTDGTGTGALFSGPTNISTDGTNLYVCDSGNHRIRRIVISSAVVTTLAGSTSGNVNGTGTAARFDGPSGLTYSDSGLYVGDQAGTLMRKVTLGGVVTTVAGTAGVSTAADGVGTAGTFGGIASLTSVGDYLFIADSGDNSIRVFDTTSTDLVTLAGGAGTGSADGTGTAATFDFPVGIELVGASLWVTSITGTVRKIE